MVTQVHNILVNFRTNVKAFNKALIMPIKKFKEMETEGGRLNKTFKAMRSTGGRLASRMRFLTHGFRGFRMEMLGVMFFGMAITRMFGGLLKPALKMVGAFDLLSTVLGMMFLPVGLWVLLWTLKMFEKWQELHPVLQKIITGFIIFGVVAGFILMMIGMLALGIGSIILLYGLLSGQVIKTGIKWLGWNVIMGGSLGLVIAKVALLVGSFMLLGLAIALVVAHWEDFKKGLGIIFTTSPAKWFLDNVGKMKQAGAGGLIKSFFSPISELFGGGKFIPDAFITETENLNMSVELLNETNFKSVDIMGILTDSMGDQSDLLNTLTSKTQGSTNMFKLWDTNLLKSDKSLEGLNLGIGESTEMINLFREGGLDLSSFMDTEMIKSVTDVQNSFAGLGREFDIETTKLSRLLELGRQVYILKGHEATSLAQEIQEDLFAKLAVEAQQSRAPPVYSSINVPVNINVEGFSSMDIDELAKKLEPIICQWWVDKTSGQYHD